MAKKYDVKFRKELAFDQEPDSSQLVSDFSKTRSKKLSRSRSGDLKRSLIPSSQKIRKPTQESNRMFTHNSDG